MSDDEKKKRAGVKTFLLRKLGSVRSRLQSERSKDILTFLMFVALSFLFWMMQSLGEDMNTVYRIPIKYTNIPDNTIITCELPTSVTVHLRDEGAVLMNYNLEGIPSFEVDFKQYANSRNAFILTSEEIKNLIKKICVIRQILHRCLSIRWLCIIHRLRGKKSKCVSKVR